MTEDITGRLSDLVLVRLHGRSQAYANAAAPLRAAVVAACRRDATVGDLAERILSRTVYAQSASRLSPLRELVQNALDATPRGGRIDVRSSAPTAEGDLEVTFTDRGRGMSRAELLDDLLVPFRSGKEADPDAIGEHGIGFLSALEIAPRVTVTSATATSAFCLSVGPLGDGPPHGDFEFTLAELDPRQRPPAGTSVHLALSRPITKTALAQEIIAVAGLCDPAAARVFVNGEPVNTARARLRRVARVPIGGGLGELDLLAGRGDGIAPRLAMVQRGLLVAANLEPFGAPSFSLHRDLLRAFLASGYGIVADLPLAVPLTKGRSAVAALAKEAVDAALLAAFERFVLEDALYDRELLRGVDHRLGAVLDRLVGAALAGEAPPVLATA
ncbi:MAG: ATP-binding protein, partial [Candidatus Eremiobacteraeota bacterium]|nr:ATP-binding protein [Candidatus Eremiobacteraeota bacterium]